MTRSLAILPNSTARTAMRCGTGSQAMKAIPVSFFRNIRVHKWAAARALLIGWLLWILYVTTIFPLITPYFFGGNLGVLLDPRHPSYRHGVS